jgi:hypothetical protein
MLFTGVTKLPVGLAGLRLPEGKFRFRMEQRGSGGEEKSEAAQRLDLLAALKEAHVNQAVRSKGRQSIWRTLKRHARAFRKDWCPGTMANGTEVMLEVDGTRRTDHR